MSNTNSKDTEVRITGTLKVASEIITSNRSSKSSVENLIKVGVHEIHQSWGSHCCSVNMMAASYNESDKRGHLAFS